MTYAKGPFKFITTPKINVFCQVGPGVASFDRGSKDELLCK